jgi:hypothetical protein
LSTSLAERLSGIVEVTVVSILSTQRALPLDVAALGGGSARAQRW